MNINLMNPDEVREQVREHYATRVQATSSCCGPASDSSCCTSSAIDLEATGYWGSALYSADELAQAPDEVATVSYGCGNPTALAALRPGEIVLDLGSGGGLDCFLAARKVGDQGYVYGVDMTDEMLDLARRNTAKAGAKNVEFRKGTIETLPLADESVDVIISNCVVNLSPDKGQVLREAFRVLRPGGRLAISDVVIDGDLDDLPVSEAQIRRALSWAGCIAGALTIDQFKHNLAEAGFDQIDVQIQQHYSLDALGVAPETVTQLLPLAEAEALARRFTSSIISAYKPAPISLNDGTREDLAAVENLLRRCKLPTDGVADWVDTLIIARSGPHVIGSTALELYGEAALLRSVAVYPSLRGTGVGHQLMTAALAKARQVGVRDLYLLTTTAGDFFPRFGFHPITRDEAPVSVKQSAEFTSLCPDSALVMHLALQ
jgi:arsenite methyltransferase